VLLTHTQGATHMLGYTLPHENAHKLPENGQKSTKRAPINWEKMREIAPEKYLLHFANMVAFTAVLAATHLPRAVRQSAARHLEVAERKQEFWARLLHTLPCTAEARRLGALRGRALVE
jgi:hypothetical protein